jgi:selenide,water dikinase
MSRLNSIGAKIADLGLSRAATDITGFGLVGHLASMCRASGVSAVINVSSVPMIDAQIGDLIKRGCVPGGTRDNLKLSRSTVDWGETPKQEKILLSDAQTSGGLLLAVAPSHLAKLLRLLQTNRIPGAVVGRMARRQAKMICMRP